MKRLKQIKEQLISCVQEEMSNLANADTKELGEAIDMIKDLEEAIYYCSITKAMKDHEEQEKMSHHCKCQTHYYIPETMRDMDKDMGRMYYPHEGNVYGERYDSHNRGMNKTIMPDSYEHNRMRESGYPTEMRDHREGSSPIQRKYYMESKELKHDKKIQMEELEKYMRELSKDITEMISDASPEETTLLKQKLVTLIEKIK